MRSEVVGARAQTLARLFNLREGFAADDAFKSGPLEGRAITEEVFAWARMSCYALMGWDLVTGESTEAFL